MCYINSIAIRRPLQSVERVRRKTLKQPTIPLQISTLTGTQSAASRIGALQPAASRIGALFFFKGPTACCHRAPQGATGRGPPGPQILQISWNPMEINEYTTKSIQNQR